MSSLQVQYQSGDILIYITNNQYIIFEVMYKDMNDYYLKVLKTNRNLLFNIYPIGHYNVEHDYRLITDLEKIKYL